MLFWGIIIFLVLWVASLQEKQKKQERDIQRYQQEEDEDDTVYNSDGTINYDYYLNGYDN